MTEEEIKSLLGSPKKGEVEIRKVQFPSLKPADMENLKTGLSHLDDVYIEVSVELGQGDLNLGELLSLEEGSVIKLDKVVGESVEVNVNQQRFAKGEVIIVNDVFNVRINAVNEVQNLKLSEGLI
ncbi:FliM/FliN family flagellar motor switch protein [Pelotomaculum terephthalicicum JT]|uniref:FliM/FliN family flagellar motor switch protein n=1 Tax=Pelotomaculum TaxID=191373 RepID=UPI0009CEF6E6|nr:MULTISPECIES: FliM/FliN family flagellar motor switch protein [Pelotomaculum]MCG9967972.1 FliM/FliN family flagellar motor switch protein [Pelotomaculum terephthalicicum JT]OPX88572.1 MAG: Flagellar motor switch protein FliN [Pelotomaculum sp. PtaB.Bin117]OPY63055.1 MAG: Flagellar motor switch protein FliN [Pelotomaculum sp. PtaU1.Bin065]